MVEVNNQIETIGQSKFSSQVSKNNLELTKTLFEKCPVCKTGKVELVSKKIFFVFNEQDLICNKCSARFKLEGEIDGEDTYSLDLSKSDEENKYNGQILKKHEWDRGMSDFDYCVEKDILPTLKTDGLRIILQSNEICHLGADAQLLEERSVGHSYGGSIRRFISKIGKI